MAVPQSEVAFERAYDPASALEVGLAVMFLTHLRPNCARSLQFAAGVWARAFKIAAEPSYVLTSANRGPLDAITIL
jgi:hypothetical protein